MHEVNRAGWFGSIGGAACVGRITASLLVIVATLCCTTDTLAQRRRPTQKPPEKKEPELPQREIKIKPVDPSTLPRVKYSAKVIDELVEQNYQKFNVKPNPPATDEQFVRRVFLDVTGTIPTMKQARVFLIRNHPEKRQRLIDDLLDSEGYSSHLYNYFADLLRVQDRLTNNVSARNYKDWLKECFEQNEPYDKMVYRMLTANGRAFDDPATGYAFRDSNMPLDAINNTIRVFLGTQIGCAQCHDHPFDRWTQLEFYQIAAYTYPTIYRINFSDEKFNKKNPITRVREELKEIDPEHRGQGIFNNLLQANTWEIWDVPTRKPQLPHDYAYSNAKPKQAIAPQTILGNPAPIKPGESPRVAFANWMTSSENPRFAKTIANRMWKRVMGLGLIEPVDDMKDSTVAENEALMEFLTQEMIRVKFDLKEFTRILLNTQAYQRSATTAEVPPGEVYHFPGPTLRRMTAEQVWDSLLTLAVTDPMEYHEAPASVVNEIENLDLATITAQEVLDLEQEYKDVVYKDRRDREKKYKYKGLLLARASELPCPLPGGHPLREFGQSDRELIQASSAEGSVPQILTMFNGPVTHMMLEHGSAMYNNVVSAKTLEERITNIFLTVLSREPTEDEMGIAREEIAANGPAGYGNVIWALVNTREFLFVQ